MSQQEHIMELAEVPEMSGLTLPLLIRFFLTDPMKNELTVWNLYSCQSPHITELKQLQCQGHQEL